MNWLKKAAAAGFFEDCPLTPKEIAMQAEDLKKDVVVGPDRHGIVWDKVPTRVKLKGPGVDPHYGDTRRDPADLYNSSGVPKELKISAIKSLKKINTQDILAAQKKSIWNGFQMIPEDVALWCMTEDAFRAVLPYVPVDLSKYDPEYHVCRSFATDFVGFLVSVFHTDGVGKVLCFEGHHSFNFVPVYTGDKVNCLVVEPQQSAVVEQPAPEHHYFNSGLVVLGG